MPCQSKSWGNTHCPSLLAGGIYLSPQVTLGMFQQRAEPRGATLTMKIINKIINFFVRTPKRDWQKCEFICRTPSGALYYDKKNKEYFVVWNRKEK